MFSFYATKTMTTGEGGMVTTDDDALAKRLRVMRLHGIDRDVLDRYTRVGAGWQYDVVAPGFKYNLTDIASAIGLVQLARAESMRQRRSRHRRALRRGVRRPAVATARAARRPASSTRGTSTRSGSRDAGIDRDAFIGRMQEQGVACSVHFIPLHLLSYWRDRYDLRPEDYPVATDAFARVVSLPLSSALTDDQVDRVVRGRATHAGGVLTC